jgi:2-dehydro-3-deoxy-L-rhamnonate dehydrogenase (NAD+)
MGSRPAAVRGGRRGACHARHGRRGGRRRRRRRRSRRRAGGNREPAWRRRHLVNNAGVAGQNVNVADYPIAEWDRVIRINLRSQFICCRAFVGGMVERNYGRIANIASIAGKEGNPTASAYSASKAGVIALTKSLAKETAGSNVSVNAIAPVTAGTRLLEQVAPAHIDYMLGKIPRGRFVTVDEIASMVAFMVSEECSFTTGATFDISGGRATY